MFYKCEDCLSTILNLSPSEDDNVVNMLSMHSSKGLSKKHVFIPACEQAFMPGDSNGDKYNEKLRLFYVAITRAENEVLITYPLTRDPSRKIKGISAGRGILSSFAKMTCVNIENK